MYKRYKRYSKHLFQPVERPDAPHETDVLHHMKLYGRYMECANLREKFRNLRVHPSVRDVGHEKAIVASRQRATECEDILRTAFDWWDSRVGRTEERTEGSEEITDDGAPSVAGSRSYDREHKGSRRRKTQRKTTQAQGTTDRGEGSKDGEGSKEMDFAMEAFFMAQRIEGIQALLREFHPLVKDICAMNNLAFDDDICFGIALELVSMTKHFPEVGIKTAPALERMRRRILDVKVPLTIGVALLKQKRATGKTARERAEEEIVSFFPKIFEAPPHIREGLTVFHMYLDTNCERHFAKAAQRVD